MSSRQLEWQQERISRGMCRQCGLRPITDYISTCNKCAKKKRKQARERRGLNEWKPGGQGRPPKA